MNDDFEKKFSDFLESTVYDSTAEALFKMVRIAYLAGWIAAGGEYRQEVPEQTPCGQTN